MAIEFMTYRGINKKKEVFVATISIKIRNWKLRKVIGHFMTVGKDPGPDCDGFLFSLYPG
jgi:hypothetical protein